MAVTHVAVIAKGAGIDNAIDMTELHIAEIPFESGGIRYRYSRKLSADGARWIRGGLFQAYHENGTLASEGSHAEGFEERIWKEFHDNGQLAAQGSYSYGAEVGEWTYWERDGEMTSG